MAEKEFFLFQKRGFSHSVLHVKRMRRGWKLSNNSISWRPELILDKNLYNNEVTIVLKGGLGNG